VYIAKQLKGIIGQDNWTNNWTNFKPATTEYNEATTILTGIISSDMVLKRTNTYVMIITTLLTIEVEP
jgi:hypothetical protein